MKYISLGTATLDLCIMQIELFIFIFIIDKVKAQSELQREVIVLPIQRNADVKQIR